MKKLLLFDIDGTLLLTGGCGQIAFERAFDDLFKIKNCWGDLLPDGKTDSAIIDEIVQRTLKRPLTRLEFVFLSDRYLDYFEEALWKAPRFRLMPGIPDLFKVLSQKKDISIGLATGNFERAAWLKLERAKLKDFFLFGGFGSDSRSRPEIVKIALYRAEQETRIQFPTDSVYVIGDTPHDVTAARASGLKSIAVLTGSCKEKDFTNGAKPDHFLADFSNPEQFLKLI